MQVFIYSNATKSEKPYPTTRHTDSLNYFYFTDEASQHTHKPNEKKKGTSLLCRPGRPARSGRIAAKMAPALAAAHTRSSNSSSLLQLSLSLLSHNTLSNNSSNNPLSLSSRTLLSNNPLEPLRRATPFRPTPPPSLVPRPFWACLRPLGQSGKPTRLLLINATGGAFPP